MKLTKLLILSSTALIINVLSYSQTANFNIDNTKGCNSLTVHFSNASTNYDSIRWFFGINGVTKSEKYPAKDTVGITYTPGTYTAKLLAYKGTHSDSSKVTINVYKSPVADFSVNKVKACVPFTASFTDASTKGDGNITGWTWQTDGALFSTSQNPTHIYNSPNQYTVLLVITDANNCTANVSKTNYIDVKDKPVVGFTPSPSGGCSVPLSVAFSNSSTGPGSLTYSWDFGNGLVSSSQAPSTTYTSLGNKEVKLTVTSTDYGCTSTLDVPGAVSIGNVLASGTLTQNGTAISNNSTICEGDNISYLSTSSGASSVSWDFGDGSTDSNTGGTHQYVAGTYTIKLTASSAGGTCSNTTQWNITVEKVSAEFTLSQYYSCSSSPVPVTFSNQSVNAVSYLWTFYDGSTSTAQTPSFTFTPAKDANPFIIHSPTSFSTILTVKSQHNCTSSASHDFTISRPTALFSVDTVQGCVPLKVNFTDQSYSTETISFYNWQFGDGTETTLSNIQGMMPHIYTTAGVFSSRLIIKNALDCMDTSYYITVKAGNKPTPDFSVSPNPYCASDLVSFTDLIPAADNVDYWQYSVNGRSVPVIPMNSSPTLKLHADIGTVNVKLLAGSNGCFAEKTKTITNNGPVDSISYTMDCLTSLKYTFTAIAKNATTYLWDFGDGQTDNSTLTPVHSYGIQGDYPVTFIGYNGSCSDTVKLLVKVRQSTSSYTAVSSACAGETVQFTAANASVDNECRDKYVWNFGDNTPIVRSESNMVAHTFTDRNTYSVVLTSIFDNGCTDATSKTIRIFKPVAKFTSDKTSGCLSPDLLVTFTDQSTADGNALKTWDWDYGNGNTYSSAIALESRTNSYNYPGQFKVVLKVTDVMNCVDTTSRIISAASPTAEFSVPTGITNYCSNTPVQLYYTFSQPDSVKWDFGDGITSKDLTDPIEHIYNPVNSDQTYSVSLTVYKYGCQSPLYTIPNYLTIQKVNAHFAVSDSVYNCYPELITFTHLFNTPSIVSGSWNFGDGGTTPYQASVSHYYQTPGVYTAKLKVKTSADCEDSVSRVIRINGPTGSLNVSNTLICKSDTVSLTMSGASNVTSFEWDLGDGRIVAGNPVKFKYDSVGYKYVYLVLHNPTCTVHIKDTIHVEEVTAKFVSDSIVCDQTNVIFTNKSTGNDQQSWNFGDGSASAELNPQHVYSTGNYIVNLYVANASGCKDTARESLVVNAVPQLSLALDKQLCSQNKAVLVATTNANTITWSPATGLNYTNTNSVVATPTKTTVYTAKVAFTTSNCFSSDSMKIYWPYADINPKDTTVVIGRKIPIESKDSSSIASFQWTPQTGLSCVNCLNPIITPGAALINYLLVLQEPNGCFSDTIRVVIRTDDSNQTLDAPSAFRPGTGDKNSTFYPNGRGIMQILEFKIYNRWGNLVFSTTDLSVGWDGKFEGKEQPIDSYIYTITVKTYDGQIRTKKGTVLLLR